MTTVAFSWYVWDLIDWKANYSWMHLNSRLQTSVICVCFYMHSTDFMTTSYVHILLLYCFMCFNIMTMQFFFSITEINKILLVLFLLFKIFCMVFCCRHLAILFVYSVTIIIIVYRHVYEKPRKTKLST